MQTIRDNNQLSPQPGPGATQEEWSKWVKDSQQKLLNVKAGIALLGESPMQQIYNSTKKSNDFEKTKTERQTIPTISQGYR